MQLVSCGYMRQYFTSKNINPADISQIVANFLADDWKFDYFYDFQKRGPTIHNIKDGGKTITCTHNTIEGCFCFSSIFSIGYETKIR